MKTPPAHLSSDGRHRRRASSLAVMLRSAGVMLGLAAGVGVLLIALGKAGGVSASGASGPQAAVEQLVEAANSEDLLGVAAALAPDEIPDLDGLVEQLQLAADEAGVSGFDSGDGVNLELTLGDVDVLEEGDNAAIVEFTLEGTLDSTALDGPLGQLLPDVLDFSTDDLLDDFEDSAITDIFLVTVQVDGEWYVSPMLTAGEYAVRAMNLLPGDYDFIGEEPVVGAPTGEDALTALLAGVADLDVDDVAEVVGPGEARFLSVFEDAIDDLLFDVEPGLFTNLEVDARPEDDGRVRLGEASFTMSYYDDWDGYTKSWDIEVDDDCLTVYDYDYGDRERACVSRIQPFYEMSDGGLVFSTVGEEGQVRIDLMATVARLGVDILAEVDWADVIASTDLARYGSAEAVEVPAEGAVDVPVVFDGVASHVFEFAAEPGVEYSVDVSGEYGDWEMYSIDDDGEWDEEWGTLWSTDAPARARVVVTSNERCNDYYCEYDGTGEATLRVGLVEHQATAFPLDVNGSIEAGETVIIDFEVPADQFVQLDVSGTAGAGGPDLAGGAVTDAAWVAEETGPSGDVYLEWDLMGTDAAGDWIYPSLPSLPAGSYELTITNYDADATFTVTSRETEPEGFGGAASTTVNLDSGARRVDGTTAANEWFEITATPSSGQDVVLVVYGSSGEVICSADNEWAGYSETCGASADASGTFQAEVVPYDSSSSYGDVVVDYYS